MTLKEKMQNGELYDCDFAALDEELDKKLWECKDLLHDFNHLRPSQLAEKEAIIKKVFASVKGSFYIEQPFHANWGCNVTIGDNFYANFNLTLVDDAPITFGDNVMVAPNETISTGTHPILPELRVKTYQYNLPVTIKDGVWIGAGTIILPGVTIGENSVIGAGSVVTKDIPANVVAVGSPCRVLREISGYDREYYRKGMKIDWSAIKK